MGSARRLSAAGKDLAEKTARKIATETDRLLGRKER
jgi:hypothetical protein